MRRTLFSLLLLLLGVGSAPPAAAGPHLATYSNDPTRLFWLVHVSDAHIGATSIEGPHASDHLEWLLTTGLDTIAPALVVASGDLCDGSRSSIPALGQEQAEWDEYRSIVDGAGMTADYFLDLPGNHDGYDDPGLTFYLANSLNGEIYGTPHRAVLLSFAFGDYLVFGANSAGDGSSSFLEDPIFTAEGVQAFEDALAAAPNAALALIFAHHRINQPDNAAAMIGLAQQHGAFYFHGHVHEYGSYLAEGLVNAQVDTLGKGDTDNVAVVAVDNDAVSYAATSSGDPWPFVVITAPADARLHTGDPNPYAYAVCNTGEANPVRALVFDASPVSEVSFAVAGGDPVPMAQDPAEPRLWRGQWDTRGLTPGETQLAVTAVGTTTRTAEVTVLLDDVDCPPPLVQPPDAGVPDAGPLPDAAPAVDASAPTADASAPANTPAQGCGCQGSGADAGASSGAGSLPMAGLLLLTVAGLGAWRRRRRVMRQGR
jgi:LPXTG-motif cell wall-anchored protein